MRVLLMLGLLALTCVNANKPLIRPSKPFNPLSSTVKAKIANHFAQHKSTHQSTIQSVQETIPTYDTAWYDAQRIDHFSFAVNPSTNRTTFSQKYLINRSYWRDPTLNLPGPIFLYTGNEGPIETFANNTGLMFDLANEFKALLVWVEHRYYGDTMPFGDQSYTNQSTMSYLTAEQALADYSQFIDWLRYDKNGPCFGKCGDIPVISFGGSYGGMLAAWFRMKYPAATQGAISASAPIWQQDNMVDPGAFNKILTNAFRRKVPQCPAGIARAWDVISYYAMANTTKVDNMTAVDYLTYVFKPLYKFNASTEEDQQTTINQLYGYLSSAYSYMGMANYPYPTEFLGPMPANPVDYACQLGFGAYQDINQASNQTILDGVYQIANVFWNYSQTVVKNDMSLNGPSTLGVGPDGWDYQSCTEMVMPLGQYGGTNDMFWLAPWSTDDFVAGCKAQYGVDADRKHMLIEWGGMHLESQSRIVFTNGDLDPWSGGGVTDTALNGAYSPSNTRGVVSYTITGGAHHLDLRFSDPADPQSVVWVRQQQRNFIHAWIDGYDSPSLENASSGLDEKWIILISVFATLLAVVLAAVLFHCCQTRRRQASQSGDYESMSH